MKKMLIILFFVVFSFPVFGQNESGDAFGNRVYIYTTDSDVIVGYRIIFVDDSIKFYLESSRTRQVLGLDKVTKVLKYDGNYMTTGGIVGGIAVLIFSTSSTTIEFWLGLLISGSIGFACALIGSWIEDWETVYSKSTAFLKNINIKQNKLSGLAVSYKVYF